MELMRTLNKQKGLTFVIVTHDPGVGKKCQRIVEMQNGRITREVRN
jgi:ABC-type lipoprotein export system ATPase subunit